MPQDYDVNDILEEIRRKKQREAATPRDTYTDAHPTAPGRAPRGRAHESAAHARPSIQNDSLAPPVQRHAETQTNRPAAREHYYDQPAQRRAARERYYDSHVQRRVARSPYEEPPVQRRVARSPYEEPPVQRRTARDPHEEPPVQRRTAHGSYEEPPVQRRTARDPHEEPPVQRRTAHDPYEEPPVQRRTAHGPYEEPPVQHRAARDLYEDPPVYDGEQPPYEDAGGFSFDTGDADDVRDPFAGETLDETMRRVRGEAPAQPDGLFGAPEDEDLPLWDDLTDSGEPEPPEDGAFEFGARQEAPVQPRGAQHRRDRRPSFEADTRSIGIDDSAQLAESRWKRSYDEQALLEDEDPDDEFASPEDAPEVAADLKSVRVGLGVKQFFTFVFAFISIYLTVSLRAAPALEKIGVKDGLLPLPPALAPENNMRLFLIANIAVVALAALFCCNVVGGGISALCRLRANSDSPAALAVLAVLVQGIVLAVLPGSVTAYEQISLYFPVAVVALFFALAGKRIAVRRVERDFATLMDDQDKFALVRIRDRELAREFARGLPPDTDGVACSAKVDFLTGFLNRSYSQDYSLAFTSIAVPICLLGSIVVAVVTFFMADRALPVAVSAFAAVLCVCAPLSSAIVPNLMQNKMSKKLARQGALLAGYVSAEEYTDTDAVVISDRDLFPTDSVMLHGMKVFAEKRIDEAILDAASVILSCGGILSGVFINMVGNNKRMLRAVDNLIYEDGMGLSAWVDGKRVLIGTQELMRMHDIDCPSHDFEARYARDGRQVLYIANSGELSAMFVVSYNASPDIMDAMAGLARRGTSLIIYTTNPNVTPELIASVFSYKRTQVHILPMKMHPEYAWLTKDRPRVAAGGLHTGGVPGVLALLDASAAVKNSVMSGTVIQLIGTIVGYGLVAFMSFTNSLKLASYAMLLLFGLAWLVVTSVVSLLRR
ncbi:hypothetical protein [Anaerotruncus sp.]|jgi:cation transport ATPase|nr:hypothetical protein [Anaerotruncus sp.]MCI8493008.1 hypothetical protein [Anaerotruncus sp.]